MQKCVKAYTLRRHRRRESNIAIYCAIKSSLQTVHSNEGVSGRIKLMIRYR